MKIKIKIFDFKFKDFDTLIIGVFEEFVKIDINKNLEFVKFEEFEEFVKIELDIDLKDLNYISERFEFFFMNKRKCYGVFVEFIIIVDLT